MIVISELRTLDDLVVLITNNNRIFMISSSLAPGLASQKTLCSELCTRCLRSGFCHSTTCEIVLPVLQGRRGFLKM